MRWIHSGVFKVPGVDIVGKLIEANLCLRSRVKDQLVEKGVLSLPEVLLIVLGHLSGLILQGLDHLQEGSELLSSRATASTSRSPIGGQ